jgi:hypothetical protein
VPIFVYVLLSTIVEPEYQAPLKSTGSQGQLNCQPEKPVFKASYNLFLVFMETIAFRNLHNQS